jgi:hypothetical protein
LCDGKNWQLRKLFKAVLTGENLEIPLEKLKFLKRKNKDFIKSFAIKLIFIKQEL